MTLYVYKMSECEQDATTHNLSPEIEKLQKRVEISQSLVGFEIFRPTAFSKKSLGRNFRLLTFEKEIQEDSIIFFLRIFPRSDSEYEWFLANYQNQRTKTEERFFCLNLEQVSSIHTNLTKTSEAEPLSPPSVQEQEWLYSVHSYNYEEPKDDLLVLESQEWVKIMSTSSKRDYYLALYGEFLENLDIEQLNSSSENNDIQHKYDTNKKIGIIYIYYKDVNQLLLLYPILFIDKSEIQSAKEELEKEESEIQLKKEKLKREIESKIQNIQSSAETNRDKILLRLAIRSYPYFMILDREAWLGIQKDKEANLALSPEEGDLLKSIGRMNSSEKFPLFINGRAGSGKSTMLQYLATDYIDFALRNETTLIPLYMTYSADLLKAARSTVDRLLKSHFSRLLYDKDDKIKISDTKTIIEESFVVFHEYLYDLLPETQKGLDFAKDKYISYSKFQQLWDRDFCKRQESRKISVDLAWHIIRSYIKGSSSNLEDDLDPIEFSSLPTKRRSVSSETYKFVYERVWLSWYKRICEEEHSWDDQDLVLAVLDSDITRELHYSAIFCDEAQDFTPIELEFIVQLSVFSKRQLHSDQPRQIPFVFAGDPLQTLNPTGFRWENIKADFYDRFSKTLDYRGLTNLTINYKELEFNYRSNPGIVNFCNLIQLVRVALVGGEKIKPQKSWWIQEQAQTVWCDIEDLKMQEHLKQNPEIVKIVNCDIGEETHYVQNDSILSSFDRSDEGIYQNVLSPGRSKGLEFDRVVLYKFGESVPDNFEDILNGDISVHDNPEARLPYEYFLNRLYVAASRAKKQLIILDSRNTVQKFWKFATDSSFMSKFSSRLKNMNMWQDYIAYLVEGTQEAWSGEPIDINQQASEYEEQGGNNHDPYLLRQAALSYRSLGKKESEVKCLSKASELEGKFEEAGNTCRNAGLSHEAFYYYWRGKCFERLCAFTTEFSSFATRPESRASDFVINYQNVPDQFLNWLTNLSSDENKLEKMSVDTTWCYVFSEIASRLKKSPASSPVNWKRAYKILSRFITKGFHIDDSTLGYIAYKADELEESVKLFERCQQTDSGEYWKAKAEVCSFPDNLFWYGKSREYSQIIAQWEKHIGQLGQSNIASNLSRDIANFVCTAALEKKKYMIALSILKTHLNYQDLEKLIAEVLKNEELKIVSQCLPILLRIIAKEKKWSEFLNFLENGFYERFNQATQASIFKEQANTLKEIVKREDVYKSLLYTAVIEIALSESLPTESPDIQAPISEFLFRHFIAQKPFFSVEKLGLPIEIVSAAIERAGKITNAIKFYESLLGYRRLPEDSKQFIQTRLIKSLEKYADYLRSNKQTNQAEDRERISQQYRRETGLGNLDLPQYPEIERTKWLNVHLDSQIQSQQRSISSQTEWKMGCLNCKLSTNRDKLRIEHQDLFESVRLSKTSQELKGDADFTQVQANRDRSKIWTIPDWNTTLSLFNQDGSFIVHINCNDNILEIDFS